MLLYLSEIWILLPSVMLLLMYRGTDAVPLLIHYTAAPLSWNWSLTADMVPCCYTSFVILISTVMGSKYMTWQFRNKIMSNNTTRVQMFDLVPTESFRSIFSIFSILCDNIYVPSFPTKLMSSSFAASITALKSTFVYLPLQPKNDKQLKI